MIIMERRFEYRGVKIVVKKGDITEENVEAIVNPANSLMIMGGGVAGAIKLKGGVEIEEEARRHAPVPIGKAVTTKAGRLKARYIIHAPTMEKPAMRIGIENVKAAVKAVIQEALKHKITRLAFPALGAGVGGIKVKDSILAILNQLKEAIDKGVKFDEVRLVAWSESDFREFLKAVEEAL